MRRIRGPVVQRSEGWGRGTDRRACPGMAKKYREVRRILRSEGWLHVRTRGSHEVWHHADGRSVVLAAGGPENREVAKGTLASIRRSTGIEEIR